MNNYFFKTCQIKKLGTLRPWGFWEEALCTVVRASEASQQGPGVGGTVRCRTQSSRGGPGGTDLGLWAGDWAEGSQGRSL